jgi:hypothetical protein
MPIICTSTNSINFGTVGIGATSSVASITITNCGFTNLTVTSILPVGSASNDFIVLSQSCIGSSIAPGETCGLDLVFAPLTNGTRNALLRLVSNANMFEIPLSGAGVVSEPGLCFSSGGTFTFPGVPDGSTGAVQSITITNCGTAPLTITGIAPSGADAGQFLVVGDACSGQTIQIGQTCEIQMQFAPVGVGRRSATLEVNDNAPGNKHTVNLVGTSLGSQPDLQINKSKGKKRWVGVGVTTPPAPLDQQTYTQKCKLGKKRVFYVNIANLGNNPDSFTISGSQDLPGSYSVKYFLGAIPQDSVDITSLVQSGSYKSSTMAGGAVTGIATMLRVEVTVDSAAMVGNTNNIIVSAISTNGKPDEVTARVIVR